MPAHFVDLTNMTFGLLKVREHVGFNENRQSMYRVDCACGDSKTVRGSDLTEGKTRSCGPDCKLKHQPKPRFSFSTMGRGTSETRFGK